MDRTPYTDEIVAMAGAGIDCRLKPCQIFKLISAYVEKPDAEKAARIYAFNHLQNLGCLGPETVPDVEGYKPHTEYIFNAVRGVWKKTISAPDFEI